MKNRVLYILVSCFVISISTYGQTCEEVKKENIKLKQQITRLEEKVAFSELYDKSGGIQTKSFNPNFDLKVLSCVGNPTDQTVRVEILLTQNNLPNQSVCLWTGQKKPIAYGEMGNGYEYKEAVFPQGRNLGLGLLEFPMFTGTSVKGYIVFRNVLSQTDKFKLVTGTFESKNSDGNTKQGEGQFEIRNLAINWK